MLYFGRLKTALILLACAVGVLLCLPNLLPAPAGWLPWRQVHLGLDLRGGSYLQMQVDMDTVVRERLDAMVDTARQSLRRDEIGYTGLAAQASGKRIVLRLRDPAQQGAALAAMRGAFGGAVQTSSSTTAPDVEVAALADGQIAAALSPVALTARGQAAVTQSIEIVRRRIDETGVLDPQITRQGDNRIVVQLPGVSDPERIKALLGTTARMTFHLVDEAADPGATAAPPGDLLLALQNNPKARIAVLKDVAVDGADLTDARAGTNQDGRWVVNFTFDGTGTRKFAAVSTANVGHKFAIVLDNLVITDPVIQTPITGGRGEISGSFDAARANDLAVLLRRRGAAGAADGGGGAHGRPRAGGGEHPRRRDLAGRGVRAGDRVHGRVLWAVRLVREPCPGGEPAADAGDPVAAGRDTDAAGDGGHPC